MTKERGGRTCGFRFSVTDGVFLALLALAGWALRGPLGPTVGVFVVVPVHFLLFCDVFRVRRSYELLWTAVFLAAVVVSISSEDIDWWIVMGIIAPLTLVLLIAEMRSPRYHGILCRRINAKHIDAWLAGEAVEDRGV